MLRPNCLLAPTCVLISLSLVLSQDQLAARNDTNPAHTNNNGTLPKSPVTTPEPHLNSNNLTNQTSANSSMNSPTDSPTDATGNVQANKYAVVVDCGSSGTRAHVYQWPANASIHEIADKIQPIREQYSGAPVSMQIRPGLSVVRDNPDAASDYMEPIMKFASKMVPAQLQPNTPVYFMGTAGMRMLSDNEQVQILDDIARDIRNEFNFTDIRTEVISGANEGVYRWLSVNSATRRLSSAYDQAQDWTFYGQQPKARRYGMVEMGGASAQVTFEVTPKMDKLIGLYLSAFPEALQVYRQSREQVALATANYSKSSNVSVFSVTFLGFGSDSAHRLAVDLLVRDAIRMPARLAPFGHSTNSAMLIEDPCLPQGAQDFMLKPVRLLWSNSPTIGYNIMPGDQTFTVHLIGKSNYFFCRHLLDRVILQTKQERANCMQKSPTPTSDPCESTLIATSFVPWRQLQFLGLGELYYTTHEMFQASGRFNGPLVQYQTIQVCSSTYESLKSEYPTADHYDPNRTMLQCFKATWLLSWLQTGLLMPMDFGTNLATVSQYGDNELDWTRGALIEKLVAR